MEFKQEQKKDRKTLLWVALAVLAALNLIQLYFVLQEKKESDNKDIIIATKTEEVLAARMKLDSISTQLDLKIAEIQHLGGSVDSLIVIKTQLEKDKNAIARSNSLAVNDFNKKVKSYETVLNQKDQEIQRLREELGIVIAQKDELAEQVQGLSSENISLTDSVLTVKQKAIELEGKVNIASALRAEEISVNAITSKGKEQDGGKYRAKKVDKLKISFRIQENSIAEKEAKQVYLRILDPDGAVLSDMATGSGSFLNNGREMIYSSKEAIQFTNTNQEVNILYGRGGIPLKKGTYAIELYGEGYKMGAAEFTVK